MKNWILFSQQIFQMALYMSTPCLNILTKWKGGNKDSSSLDKLADELIPLGLNHTISEYDFKRLADISSQGEMAPPDIILNLKFCVDVDMGSLYFTLFGTYLSDVFYGCTSEEVKKFDKTLYKTIGTIFTIKAGKQLSFVWSEAKSLSIVFENRKSYIFETKIANKLLEVFLNKKNGLVSHLLINF